MYDNTNKGTLGRNKRKSEESHPTHTGKINVNGVDFWLSAWVKKNSDTGEQFFALSLKPKDGETKAKPAKPTAKATEPEDFYSDDIPF